MDLYEIISKIGKSFFIDYCYYLYIDSNERRWEDAGHIKTRLNKFNKLSNNDIRTMLQYDYSDRININEFGLNYEELCKMRKELIELFDSVQIKTFAIEINNTNYTIKSLKNVLNLIEKENQKLYQKYNLVNPDSNIEIESIERGCWIIKISVSILKTLGEKIIEKFVEELIENIKNKTKKNKKCEVEIKNE